MKRGIMIALKIVFSLGLLALLFYRFPLTLERWRTEWENLQWNWFWLSLLTAAISIIIGIARWHFLLKTQDIHLGFVHTLAIGFIGLFFSIFSIGVIGGDAARAFYLFQIKKIKKTPALFSIFLDRILGFLGLCALAFCALPLSWRWLSQEPESKIFVLFLSTMLGAGMIGLLSALLFRKKNWGLFHLIKRWSWGKNLLEQMDQALEICLQKGKTLISVCFILSIGVHLSLIFCGYFLARAFSLPIPFLLMTGMMPIVNAVITLPITISGLGLRETAFLLLFRGAHIGEEKAFIFSLTYWILAVILALIGGLLYIFYRCPKELRTNKVTAHQ
ncbi:MAG: flippase-like domain-containing protein [Verrucomicrobiae bacterium]|nr:flippase-like domain-containing protein [Verrucomicrobiae bacterium]